MSELQEARWYVVHTYSGHENKVKAYDRKSCKQEEWKIIYNTFSCSNWRCSWDYKTGKEN